MLRLTFNCRLLSVNVEIASIQASTELKFKINELSSSWEVPALVDQTISYVSDSDGVSYPWYGSGTEIATIKGPTNRFTEVKVK